MKKEIPVVITSDVEADDKLNHKDCGALRSILACSSESTQMLVDGESCKFGRYSGGGGISSNVRSAAGTYHAQRNPPESDGLMTVDSMSSMNLSNFDADFAHRDRTQSDVESGINPGPGSMSRSNVNDCHIDDIVEVEDGDESMSECSDDNSNVTPTSAILMIQKSNRNKFHTSLEGASTLPQGSSQNDEDDAPEQCDEVSICVMEDPDDDLSSDGSIIDIDDPRILSKKIVSSHFFAFFFNFFCTNFCHI